MCIIEENKFYRLKTEFRNSGESPTIRIIKRKYDEETNTQIIYYQEISEVKTSNSEKFLANYESVPLG